MLMVKYYKPMAQSDKPIYVVKCHKKILESASYSETETVAWRCSVKIVFLRYSKVWNFIKKGVLPNRAPISNRLHPAPPSAFQPPQSSLQHTQLYKNQNNTNNWANFPKFRPKFIFKFNSKLSFFPEDWHTWYVVDAHSESGLRFRPFTLAHMVSQECWFLFWL